MAIQAIQQFNSTNEIPLFPGASGIGVVGGVPYMRTVNGLISLGNALTGNIWFVDPVTGNDTTGDGRSPASAFATLGAALSAATAGNNDVVYLVGDGATTATARLSASLNWNKAATHLVGISSGTMISGRARVAPTSGIASFTNLVTVSASGCYFANIQFFHGFDAGAAAAICMAITGGRNRFDNCHIAGMGSTDHADADDTGSRSLTIGTTGENEFNGCTIGLDTVTRNAANATLEFLGVGNPRNVFRNCLFPSILGASAAAALMIKVGGAARSDRFQLFDRCMFINAVKSGGTAMTALCTLAASIGGMIVLKDCTAIGITDLFSDATTSGQMFIDGAPPAAATSGLAVAPA
jgi:hypothetical protein